MHLYMCVCVYIYIYIYIYIYGVLAGVLARLGLLQEIQAGAGVLWVALVVVVVVVV